MSRAGAADVGVNANRIAVPYVQLGAGEWRARIARHALNIEREVEFSPSGNCPGHRIGANIRALKLLIDEVWASVSAAGKTHEAGVLGSLGFVTSSDARAASVCETTTVAAVLAASPSMARRLSRTDVADLNDMRRRSERDADGVRRA